MDTNEHIEHQSGHLPTQDPRDHTTGSDEEPSWPSADGPNLTFNYGKTDKDDGAIIDSFFVDTDAPPAPIDMVDVINAVRPPVAPTGMYTTTIAIDNTWATPVLLAPRDSHRQSLSIRVFNATAGDFIRFADEQNKVMNPTELLSGRIYVSDGWFQPPGSHTGAVWAIAPTTNTTNPITVTIVAITNPPADNH